MNKAGGATLHFADGSTLTVDKAEVPLTVAVSCGDFTALANAWETFLDPEKTAAIEVTEDNKETATLYSMTLTEARVAHSTDGTMTASFYMDCAPSGDADIITLEEAVSESET